MNNAAQMPLPQPSPASGRGGNVARRHRAERRFRCYGIGALCFALLLLVVVLGSIIHQGWGGLYQYQMRLPVTYDAAVIDPENTRRPDMLRHAFYLKLAYHSLRERFSVADNDIAAQRALYVLLSRQAETDMKTRILQNPARIGSTEALWLPLASAADQYFKGRILRATPETQRKLTNRQMDWLDSLQKSGDIRRHFNSGFFTESDSRAPERAGFLGAIIGSILTVLACMAVAFPLGVMTAVYLEEFAHKSRWVDVIEVNINNLAAVPSIIFGLLGLSLYIGFFGMPRSAALVGGLTLALMILPVIIITTRVALKAVPGSIRAAAIGLGASPVQVVLHHTLPLAMPGIMTGTILGVARALGETAPLLMIGMVAFIVDIPRGFTDPATVMPVQVYLWASSPEIGFLEKTATGIMVLVGLLVLLNAAAIIIRKKFETRW